MATKSFFSSFFDLIAGKDENISAQKALLLQKDYINNLSQDKTKLCTPPFMEIAKQLESKKNEIFRAAVYYLIRIAENETQYAEEILHILHASQKKKHPADDLQFLKTQTQSLEQKNNQTA